MAYAFGEIVLVAFPFTNQQASKRRPAVVVSNATYNGTKPDVVIMAVTSQRLTRPGFGELVVQDWQTAGLLTASAIKPVFATLEQTLIRRTLGQLSAGDQQALRGVIAQVIG